MKQLAERVGRLEHSQAKLEGLLEGLREAITVRAAPARDERSMNLCRYFLPLLVVLLLSGPLSAQETDEDGQFYLNFSGSAIFPYEPAVPRVVLGGTENFPGSLSLLGGPGNKFKTGAGFTAAFGYAFKEGFSTEMEWGYQKIRTDNSTQNLSLSFPSRRGFLDFEGFEPPPISITIENSGEIKTWSLMGNVYYRYPKWRVSPYAGFGLGAFFHDRTATSIAAIENLPRSPFGYLGVPIFGSIFSDSPPEPLKTTATYEDSRFAYQIMAGLSARISKLVEIRCGYRFRSSRGEPIDADQIEAGIRFRF